MPSLSRAREVVSLSGRSLVTATLELWNSDDLTYAASIAYYGLLSLFPMFLLALALLGRATADADNRNAVLAFVLAYFPTQFDFITKQIDAFRASGSSVSVAGILALIWGAFGVFGAVNTAVNYAWGVDERPGFWRHKLLSFSMLGFGACILLVAVVLVSASQLVAANWFAGVLFAFPGLNILRGFTVRYLSTLVFILVVGLLFWGVPNTRVRFRDVWIGALLTGVLWRIAIAILSILLSNVDRLAVVNGSIAVVVAFLGWLYVQAVIFLFGVEFTAAYAHLRRVRAST
jgi:membrane protein